MQNIKPSFRHIILAALMGVPAIQLATRDFLQAQYFRARASSFGRAAEAVDAKKAGKRALMNLDFLKNATAYGKWDKSQRCRIARDKNATFWKFPTSPGVYYGTANGTKIRLA